MHLMRRPGQFRLEIDGGISAFRSPKPALVMMSTAAVERNAIIGNDEAARKADIPIVQLNPGGADIIGTVQHTATCSFPVCIFPLRASFHWLHRAFASPLLRSSTYGPLAMQYLIQNNMCNCRHTQPQIRWRERGAGGRRALLSGAGVQLTTEAEDVEFLLEARQGDAISGNISRAEVAQVVANALGTSSAAGEREFLICGGT